MATPLTADKHWRRAPASFARAEPDRARHASAADAANSRSDSSSDALMIVFSVAVRHFARFHCDGAAKPAARSFSPYAMSARSAGRLVRSDRYSKAEDTGLIDIRCLPRRLLVRHGEWRDSRPVAIGSTCPIGDFGPVEAHSPTSVQSRLNADVWKWDVSSV
jgi:hypothetical protein